MQRSLLRWVRQQAWCLDIVVHFEKPNPPAGKMADQFPVGTVSHIPGPNYLGFVNLRFVVNPFAQGIMPRPISYDHQMVTNSLIQPV